MAGTPGSSWPRDSRSSGSPSSPRCQCSPSAPGRSTSGRDFPIRTGPRSSPRPPSRPFAAGTTSTHRGWVLPDLRRAIAAHQQRFYGLEYDPDREVLVTAGATEAIAATILAVGEPADEVVMFEPSYDSYAPAVAMAGATCRVVPLRPPSWDFDVEQLAVAITPTNPPALAQLPAQSHRKGI